MLIKRYLDALEEACGNMSGCWFFGVVTPETVRTERRIDRLTKRLVDAGASLYAITKFKECASYFGAEDGNVSYEWNESGMAMFREMILEETQV
ncbi:hypothetical protein [Selenomonas ruminantium]|uniref:hypothetical protein n=1 Tax=Selenomonas ruminantium TaxID=971 RepID=UPI0005A5568E|nr:hypothetical protein [Selenomonas ruminantium]